MAPANGIRNPSQKGSPLARNNSALKAKMPKVKQHNKIEAATAGHRSAGDYRVFLDLDVFRTYTQASNRFDFSALGGKTKGDDGKIVDSDPADLLNVWDVLDALGIAYDRIVKVPASISSLVDPVIWAERATKNLARAAGASARCALVGDVVVENYSGPSNAECSDGEGNVLPVRVFYPSICKIADPTFRIVRDKDTGIAQDVVSSMTPASAMSAGIAKIMGRTRVDLLAETSRKVNQEHSLEALLESDLEVGAAATHSKPWASDCTVTDKDGNVTVIKAEDGFTSNPQRLRIKGVEYLEAGSKRETRPADEAALQMVSYQEMLTLIPDPQVRMVAAFLLLLKSQDSLRSVEAEVTDEKGKRERKQNYRNLKAWEVWKEWNREWFEVDGALVRLPSITETRLPWSKDLVRQAFVALAKARDDYMDSMVGTEASHDGEIGYNAYKVSDERIVIHKVKGERVMSVYWVDPNQITPEVLATLKAGFDALTAEVPSVE